MEDKAFIHLKKCDHDILARAKQIDRIPWADHLSPWESVTLARFVDSYEAERDTTILYEGSIDAHMLLVVWGKSK